MAAPLGLLRIKSIYYRSVLRDIPLKAKGFLGLLLNYIGHAGTEVRKLRFV